MMMEISLDQKVNIVVYKYLVMLLHLEFILFLMIIMFDIKLVLNLLRVEYIFRMIK